MPQGGTIGDEQPLKLRRITSYQRLLTFAPFLCTLFVNFVRIFLLLTLITQDLRQFRPFAYYRAVEHAFRVKLVTNLRLRKVGSCWGRDGARAYMGCDACRRA